MCLAKFTYDTSVVINSRRAAQTPEESGIPILIGAMQIFGKSASRLKAFFAFKHLTLIRRLTIDYGLSGRCCFYHVFSEKPAAAILRVVQII
jgi:hypothetical protein